MIAYCVFAAFKIAFQCGTHFIDICEGYCLYFIKCYKVVSGYQACGKEVFNRLEKAQSSSTQAKLFYTYLKPESGSTPTVASTARLFKYIYDSRFNPQHYKYLPDELLPVSKTPFAWVLFDRFEPIKESAGK